MYSRHRFPGEIISHCVWLYYTFPLSYRDIEKMMLYRGIEVTYETIREWCQKFGQMKNVEHRPHKGLNNRAENSHQLTRVRERRVRRFKSRGFLQGLRSFSRLCSKSVSTLSLKNGTGSTFSARKGLNNRAQDHIELTKEAK